MTVEEALIFSDQFSKPFLRETIALVALATEVRRLREAIIATLDENAHLADGDNCTLISLKRVCPEWEVKDDDR